MCLSSRVHVLQSSQMYHFLNEKEKNKQNFEENYFRIFPGIRMQLVKPSIG